MRKSQNRYKIILGYGVLMKSLKGKKLHPSTILALIQHFPIWLFSEQLAFEFTLHTTRARRFAISSA